MCTVQEGYTLMPEKCKPSSLEGRTCMKCHKEEAVVIIRIDDPFCKECFLAYCTHKFRSSFGKSQLLRDKEKVLVTHSGGATCTAMLHLIQEGTSKRAHKKLRFLPSLVYIDEGVASGQSFEERGKSNAMIADMLKNTGLDCYMYSLEQVLSCNNGAEAASLAPQPLSDSYPVMGHQDLADKLHNLLAAAKTTTAKDALLQMLRKRLLSEIARCLGVTKVLLGDTSTRLAIRLLSNITQGRGAHLPFEMSFADQRLPDMTLVRPLREFTAKEVDTYNRLYGLEPIFQSPMAANMACGTNQSLDSLTEEFVLGLQADFPNTVSTIVRTGEKLDAVNTKDLDADLRCCMCQAPLDTEVGQCSALNATEFSKVVCQSIKERLAETNAVDKPAVKEPASDGGDIPSLDSQSSQAACCGQGDRSCSVKRSVDRDSLKKALCYGCRLLLQDLSDPSCLPPSWLSEAEHRANRATMRESIQEFLLEDDDS